MNLSPPNGKLGFGVADVWDGFAADPETRWSEVQALSSMTLESLGAGDAEVEETADLTRILTRWTFPLWHVELHRIEVDLADLRREQENWYPEF